MASSGKRRWVLLGVTAAVVGYLLWTYWPADNSIIISPETTYITEPVNADGTVNYVAALNRMYSRGVTPENNAAPLLLRVLGPDVLDETVRRRILNRLELDLPDDGEFFVRFRQYEQEHAPPQPETQPQDREDEEETIRDRLARAGEAPWSADEFPVIAAWLEANKKPMALAIEATRRERCYLPLVCPSRPESVLEMPFPMLAPCMDLARALAARAMLKLDAGDIEGARADLTACHRMARLLGQGPSLVARMVAIACESIACTGDIAVATSGKLTGPQARAFLAELESLPPLPDAVEAIDKLERFLGLDIVTMLSRGGSLDEIGAPRSLRLMSVNVDWNVTLRIFNDWYNRDVAACRLPHAERRAANAAFDDDVNRQVASRSPVRGVAMILQGLGGRLTRKAFTHNFTNVLMTMILPSLSRASEFYDVARMTLELAKLAMALAACKAETGQYPAKLDDLKRGYVKAIPQDIFTLKPLVYRRVGGGYLLYSLGRNMTDDGGKRDPEGDEDADDISVEVK